MLDMIIKNGTIVSPEGCYQGDIAIKNGKIDGIGSYESFSEAKRTVDASGKYIFPGMIDGHLHIAAPFMGCIGPLDFYSASQAAAFGGVTTIIDFTNTQPGDSVIQKIHERKKEMEIAAVDYGVHAKIVEASPKILAEIKEMVQLGCPTLKMFTTYRKAGVMIEDSDILKVMFEAKKYGARPGVHAEDNAISEYNNALFEQESTTGWKYHALSKPASCEALATTKMIEYAKYSGSELYIFHLTCKEALEAVQKAQDEGYPIYAETCLHYLEFTQKEYENPEGYRIIMSPPLREAEDIDALWKGLKKNSLSIVSSDNCLYSDQEKLSFLEKDSSGNILPDYNKVANGVSGLEERLMVLLTDGVGTGKLTLEHVCEIGSTNPAKIFGMYPKKGIIQPGSDADIVIVDMEFKKTLSYKTLHYGIDSSIYEGKEVKGVPVITIRRGEIIMEQNTFIAKPGSGEFIKRSLK